MAELLSFLDIEAGLENVVAHPFADQAKHIASTAGAALKRGDEHAAIHAVHSVSTKQALKENRGKIEVLAMSAILLGVHNAGGNMHDTDVTDHPQFGLLFDNALKQYDAVMGRILEDHVKRIGAKAVSEIMNRDAASENVGFRVLIKADIDEDFVAALNKAVDSGGRVMSSIAANMTTSRLVSFGFLAQAMADEVDVYRLQAVMDKRTSDVCRALHGRTFQVKRAYQHVLNTLQITDPEELKTAAPWLKASDAGKLEELSRDELQSRYGVLVPPFHPGCRTVLVRTSASVQTTAQTPVAIPKPTLTQIAEATKPTEAITEGVSIDTAINQAVSLDQIEQLAKGSAPGLVIPPMPYQEAPYDVNQVFASAGEMREVNIDDLISIDQELPVQDIRAAIPVSVHAATPLVVSSHGELYVQDDLADVIAAKMRGETTIMVRMVTLVNKTDASSFPQIELGLLKTVGDLTIWMVDGKLIRDRVFIDFTEGGNSMAYPKWMPPKKIYLDTDVNPAELRFVMLHELREYNVMQQLGWTYDDAHSNSANVLEQEARDNPDKWQELWDAEVDSYLKFNKQQVQKAGWLKKMFVYLGIQKAEIDMKVLKIDTGLERLHPQLLQKNEHDPATGEFMPGGAKPAQEGGVLYHGTLAQKAIEENGFIASKRGSFGPGVYLTDSLPFAKSYGHVVEVSTASVGTIKEFTQKEFVAYADKVLGNDETIYTHGDKIVAAVQKEGFSALAVSVYDPREGKDIRAVLAFDAKSLKLSGKEKAEDRLFYVITKPGHLSPLAHLSLPI